MRRLVAVLVLSLAPLPASAELVRLVIKDRTPFADGKVFGDVGAYEMLGETLDDAAGEAFDKTAKLLGLPQPGGPSVEAEAILGDARRFQFPRPLMDREGCDMSFSGLKTALLRARDALVAEKGGITVQDRRDLCARVLCRFRQAHRAGTAA